MVLKREKGALPFIDESKAHRGYRLVQQTQ